MRTTTKEKRNQYRIVYEVLWEKPRVKKKEVSAALGKRGAGRWMEEAFEEDYIVGPEFRKKSFKNLKEYMYFIRCKDPDASYLKYRKDPNVIYHAQMAGFCDLWVITKEKMDIEGEIIVEGYRSDYHVSYAPDHTWETGLQNMRKMVDDFDPENYTPKGIIQTHFNKTIEWDKEDEIMYAYFKYNVRKSLLPLIREHGISREKIYSFLQSLPDCCTVATSYYPESLQTYDPYLFMFETDYEDFIIDLFSELPTSVSFFKVFDKLFVFAHVLKPFIRSRDIQLSQKYYLPLLVIKLSIKKILKSKARAIMDYSWSKNI